MDQYNMDKSNMPKSFEKEDLCTSPIDQMIYDFEKNNEEILQSKGTIFPIIQEKIFIKYKEANSLIKTI